MKNFLLLCYIFLFAISCNQQLIEIELPDFEQKVVANCLFSENNQFILKLTETRYINDSIEKIITDADCYLLLNSIPIDTFVFIDSLYYSGILPVKDNIYELKIITKDGVEYSSTGYLPNLPIISEVEQMEFAVFDNSNITNEVQLPLNRLSFTILDPIDEKNYYEVKILLIQDWDNNSSFLRIRAPYIFTSQDIIIKNEDILDYEPNIIVFSDTLFNGQTKTIDFLYKPAWLKGGSGSDGSYYTYNNYRLYYQFREISKEMYLYRKSLIKHIYNQQSDNFELFGDPVQMYSNIINGYGIFAGYSEICDSVFVEAVNYYY